jgi:O-antigen/teichoic acid export membrane protein
LVALTGVVLCIIFGGVAWQRQDALWLVISAYLLLAALNHAPEILFLSHTRYRRTAALTLTRSLARLALLASLPLWSGSARLIGVALTYPLMETLTLLVSLWMARPIWRELQTAATGRADLRALMRRQGVWVMLAIPVKRVSDELPTWLLKSLAGDVAVGLYGAAHKAMNMAYSIFAPLETILFPLVSELVVQDSERIRLMLRQTQKYTVWLSLAMILACVPLAPWLVLFIGGSQYAPTVPVLQWSLLYLMPLAFMQSQRPMFYALSEQRWMLFTHLLGVALYAPLLWIGIRSTGPIGAAQAMVFYGILLAAIRLVVLRRLAPELWVSPLEVFGIDQFDRELFRRARLRLRRLISAHGRSDIA